MLTVTICLTFNVNLTGVTELLELDKPLRISFSKWLQNSGHESCLWTRVVSMDTGRVQRSAHFPSQKCNFPTFALKVLIL